MESSEMRVSWIVIPSVLDKLLEFDEVSSEIRNANSKYSKHLPPLPSCLSKSAQEIELQHLPAPTARHTEESDFVAPGHLANKVQHISTTDNQRPLDDDCEPYVPSRHILSEEIRKFEFYSKCLLEQLTAPDTQCTSSAAIEISTPESVKNAVTEQTITPAEIQLLDASLADEGDLVPDEATESAALVSAIAAVKNDGDELQGPAMTTEKLITAEEQPMQDRRRRSFLSSFGRRLLNVGRMLCCCCCCPK